MANMNGREWALRDGETVSLRRGGPDRQNGIVRQISDVPGLVTRVVVEWPNGDETTVWAGNLVPARRDDDDPTDDSR